MSTTFHRPALPLDGSPQLPFQAVSGRFGSCATISLCRQSSYATRIFDVLHQRLHSCSFATTKSCPKTTPWRKCPGRRSLRRARHGIKLNRNHRETSLRQHAIALDAIFSLRTCWAKNLIAIATANSKNAPKTRAQLMAAWDSGWKLLLRHFDSLTDESDLTKIVTIRTEPHSVMQAINRQLAHYTYHLGQIIFLAKHFAGQNWQSLTVPRKASQQFTADVAAGKKSQR